MNQIRRLYIGMALGVVITLLLPVERIESLLRPVVDVIINIGRYIFIPAMFFGIIAGFARRLPSSEGDDSWEAREGAAAGVRAEGAYGSLEARAGARAKTRARADSGAIANSKRVRSLYVYAFLIFFLTTLLLVGIGGGAILLVSLPRLSIISQEFEAVTPLGLQEIFSLTFPQSLFSVFSQNGDFILPIAIVALVFGFAIKSRLRHDAIIPKVSIEMSSVFDFLLHVYISFLGVGMILISSYLIVQLRLVADIQLFYQFIVALSVLTAIIIVVVYPLLALAFRCKFRLLSLIRNILGSTLVSVISGDSYFSSIMVLRLFQARFSAHKGVPYNLTLLGMLFGRAGSAFVASAVFFMILQSYTAIEITFFNTVWVMVMIIAFSPLASAAPRLGMVHLLVAVAGLYGNGLENGFLIIVPLLPFLISVATLLDTFTVVFFGYLLADKLGFSESVVPESGRIKRNWTVVKKIIS